MRPRSGLDAPNDTAWACTRRWAVWLLPVLLLLAGCRPSAVWSPDGKQIAFAYHGVLFTFDTATHRFTRRTTGPRAAVAPTWSPDGRSLAFYLVSASDDEVKGISLETLDVVSGRRRTLVPALTLPPHDDDRDDKDDENDRTNFDPENPELVLSLCWMTGGSRLLYTNFDASGPALSVVGRNGSGAKRLLPPRTVAIFPSLSPDGRRIVFFTKKGVSVADADGRNVRQIWDSGSHPDAPAAAGPPPQWSPDGRSVLVVADAETDSTKWLIPNACEVWRVPLAGSPPERLARLRTSSMFLGFSARGDLAAFYSPDPKRARDPNGQDFSVPSVAAFPFTRPRSIGRLDERAFGAVKARARGGDEDTTPEQMPTPAISPDGRRVAGCFLPAGRGQPLLAIWPVRGGASGIYPIPKVAAAAGFRIKPPSEEPPRSHPAPR